MRTASAALPDAFVAWRLIEVKDSFAGYCMGEHRRVRVAQQTLASVQHIRAWVLV